MKRKKSYFFIVITVLLFSCKTDRLVDLEPIAIEIITRVGGNDGSVHVVENQNIVSNKTNFYVELVVGNSDLVHKFKADKKIVASYCALELYRRIPKSWGDEYYGYNIIFDSEENFLSPRTYFYTREELESISPALEIIDDYINAVSEDRLEYATALIDATPYMLNAQEATAKVAGEIGTNIIETRHFFMPLECVFDSDTMECLTVTCMVFRSDSQQRNIYFRMPRFSDDTRILKVETK